MKAKARKAHGSHEASCSARMGNSGMAAGHFTRRIYVDKVEKQSSRTRLWWRRNSGVGGGAHQALRKMKWDGVRFSPCHLLVV